MLSGNRGDEYKSTNYSSSRDLRLKKLKGKLREHIRLIHYYSPLTESWIKMADSISQVAEVAFMELEVPFKSDSQVKELKGRKPDGTLWDQEEDQLAIRILLEEGKINLCMRLLDEYKNVVGVRNRKVLQKKAADETSIDIKLIEDRMDQFEKGMGIILHLSVQHEEVLQILDLPMFLAYMSRIIQHVEDREDLFKKKRLSQFPVDFNGADKTQEAIVFHYLSSVSSHIESIDEERIMSLIEQYSLLSLTINHIAANRDWYANDTIAAVIKFLHNIFDSETYMADKDTFIFENEVKENAIIIHDEMMPKVLTSARMGRGEVKAFIDNCKVWKFELKKE